jgi:hypothetical protein
MSNKTTARSRKSTGSNPTPASAPTSIPESPDALAAAALELPRLATIEPLPGSGRKATIQHAVIAGLAMVATARTTAMRAKQPLVDDSLLSEGMIDELEQVCYALLTFDEDAESTVEAAEDAELEEAYAIRKRFHKLANHHLDEDEAVAEVLGKVDLVRVPTKVGPDILKLCKALLPHVALISQDPTWWKAGDLERGPILAKKLIDGQAVATNGLAGDETLGRLWALLIELYADVRDALWFLSRKDEAAPELPGFWKKVRQIRAATKKPKAEGETAEAEADEEADDEAALEDTEADDDTEDADDTPPAPAASAPPAPAPSAPSAASAPPSPAASAPAPATVPASAPPGSAGPAPEASIEPTGTDG